MRRKRVLAACASAAMLVTGMTACGSSSEDTGAINVWIGFTDYRLDWAKERAAEFEDEHPEYSIKVDGFDTYEALWDKLTAASEQDETPTIVQNFEAATQESRDAVDNNDEPLFKPLEDAIDGRDEILDEPVVIDDVVESARDYYTLDGKFHSMPWNTSTPVFYSNSDYMEEAGIDEPPETWDEIGEACDKIDELDDGPKHCMTWPNQAWFLEQPLAEQGELLVDNDNGRADRAENIDMTSPEFMAWVDVWTEMNENGQYVYSGKQEDWDGPKNAFTGQDVAFMMTSSGDASLVAEEAEKGGYDFEVSRMPLRDPDNFAGNFIGGATLYLANGLETETEDGALAFMQFLNNPENAADWHRETGYIPITESANELLEEEGWFDDNPHQSVALEQLEAGDGSPAATGPLVGNFVAIRAVMTQAMEDIMTNGDDPKQRFEEAEKEAQDLLDEYNSLYVE